MGKITTKSKAAEAPLPDRRRKYNAAVASAANRELKELIKALGAVSQIADAWLSAGHGPECGCALCAFHGPGTMELAAADVSGALWSASATVGLIESFALMSKPRGKAVRS